MFSFYHSTAKKSKLINQLVIGSAVSFMISSGLLMTLENLSSVSAQALNPINSPKNRLIKGKPGADDLRPGPGLPIIPTVVTPIKASQATPAFAFDLNAEPVVPVTPYIPNASPDSPNRNVPGAFTTDPLRAVPILQQRATPRNNSTRTQ